MINELKRCYKIFRVKRKQKKIIFAKGANFDRHAQFEGLNRLGANSWFEGYLGYGSYIGDESLIKAKVGRFCSIGHKVSVLTGSHPAHVFVSTSPMFFSLRKQNGETWVKKQKYQEISLSDRDNNYGCIIGNDVWIGYNATIMGGCNIGDGAIVAAGALVNKDVEPYTIVAGQPARVISKRFTEEQIQWLCDFRWWDKSISWLKEHAEEFENIESFIQKYK